MERKPMEGKHQRYVPGLPRQGIHGRLREIFEAAGYSVKVALLDDPEQGLSREVLENTDVLVYWSHIAQQEVPDETAERIAERVDRGMGFIPLHSAHMSKPFVRLTGTTCTLRWRESDDEELMWTACAGHPITRGVPPCVRFAPEEMYGEYLIFQVLMRQYLSAGLRGARCSAAGSATGGERAGSSIFSRAMKRTPLTTFRKLRGYW